MFFYKTKKFFRFALLDIFKNVQFSFSQKSFFLQKHTFSLQSIMQLIAFFNSPFDCTTFFIVLFKTNLGVFFVNKPYTILFTNDYRNYP